MIHSVLQPHGVRAVRHRVLLCLALTTLLMSVYMITYSGWVQVSDEHLYFNAIRSLIDFGDSRLDLTMWQALPVEFQAGDPLPFRSILAEPGITLAGAPLYWLAKTIPGLGLAHTVFLLNIIACALVCAVVFWYALELGYSERTAVIGALMLGLGTIVFPYSQTFFREPLAMIFLTLSALMLEWGRRSWRWIAAGLAVFLLAFFTKDASLLALPGMLLILVPDTRWHKAERVLRWVLGIVLLLVVLIAYTDFVKLIESLLPVGYRIGDYQLEPQFTRDSVHTALFSIGGSLWGTSPLLLLAIPGAALLWKQGRTVWVALVIVLTYVFGYSLFRGEEWFGGLNWPQRFLMPTLPFVILLVLPVMERLRSRRVQAAVILLVLYSLWWQVSALAFPWETYSELIYEESGGGLSYWGPGLNDVRYIRPVVLLDVWGDRPFNAVWVRMALWWIPALYAALIGGALWVMARGRGAWLLPLLLISALALTLTAIYPDPLYSGNDPSLFKMAALIDEQLEPDDILMLDDPKYSRFFINYGSKVRTAVFPYHPGERGSFDQPIQREADNPAAVLADLTIPVVAHLAQHHDRLYFLTSGGPEVPWSVRPFERFMGQHYYRVREQLTDADVRLLEYATTPAPDLYSFYGPDTLTDLTYTAPNGDMFELVGYSLPDGTTYSPGQALPLSLYWRAQQTPSRGYTVAWFVAEAESGFVRAQGENTAPGAGFEITTALKPDLPVWDHRALFLPPDLPPGAYHLLVVVYDVVDGVIQNLDVSGESTRDGYVGILPARITVK